MKKRQEQAAIPPPAQPRWRWAWSTLPLLLVAGVTFTAANQLAEVTPCRALDIEVDQMNGMYFVDAPSLEATVTQQFALFGQPLSSLPYGDIHRAISRQPGVAECTVEPTLGGALKINVRQQRPTARVWTPDSVLYLDDAGRPFPLSPRYTAEVPVIHAPHFNASLAAVPLLNAMDQDPFWNRLIDQIEVDDAGLVSFRPRIADLVVHLGSGQDLDKTISTQLNRLRTFYRAQLDSGDLRQYSTLDLRYEGQLVASK